MLFDGTKPFAIGEDVIVRRNLAFFAPASKRAFMLSSSASTWRRSVVVGATPRMKSRLFARQKSITSGQQ